MQVRFSGNLRKTERASMPTLYKIDKERRLVMTTVSGVPTFAEAVEFQNNLKNDPDFDPSFSHLMDFRSVSRVDLTGDEIRALAVANVFSANSRRAFLVNNDVGYGIGRMFGTLREITGDHGARVFRDLDQALEWALQKR